MLDGIQDKKTTLDDFYIKYSKWDSQERQETQARFDAVLQEIRELFNGGLSISKSRFRQKADFYTLFIVVNDFVGKHRTIVGKDTSLLRADLEILQENIRPESIVPVCREYAIKCVFTGKLSIKPQVAASFPQAYRWWNVCRESSRTGRSRSLLSADGRPLRSRSPRCMSRAYDRVRSV